MVSQLTQSSHSDVPRLLIDVEGVCAALHMSRSQVYRLFAKGELRGVRLGRSRRVLVSDLEAFCCRLVEQSSGSAE